jgi:hypothetical protein
MQSKGAGVLVCSGHGAAWLKLSPSDRQIECFGASRTTGETSLGPDAILVDEIDLGRIR